MHSKRLSSALFPRRLSVGRQPRSGEPHARSAPKPAVGIEGQRRADLGNGTYLNPIVAGDHPDPTVLKDGDDYYMTFSSFFSYPGVIIWHSRDLVNWAPVGPALTKPIGTVWAMDLVKHKGRYFIYIPATPGGRQSDLRRSRRRYPRPVERSD